MYTLYQLAQMWNKRERERWSLKVVSRQTLKMEPDFLLRLSYVVGLPYPCPFPVQMTKSLSWETEYVSKLVDYNDFYLHNKIKIFPNPQGVLFPSPCILF